MSHTYVPAFTLEPEKRAAPASKAPDGPRTPNFINDIAAGKVELPTIPRIVQQVAAALRDPNADARKIGATLAQDPVLSAKVLRLANSSFFGGQRSMASIDAAVALIGTQALGRLVLAGGVAGSFGAVPGIDLPTFWRDSLIAATAAQKIAPRLGAEVEEAYISGLLHGAGHLILCKTYPDIADFVFTGYAVARGAELAAIEQENFGIDHPSVGALWIETIGFPQRVADAIRHAVQPLSASAGPLDLTLRSACALAAAVARKDDAATAFASLPPVVQERFGGAAGPDATFDKLYEALQETEPKL
jgi:HD-like signal output (HDOD) protein